ncbi:hypothetical protein EYY48_13955 [Enterococcus faecalis]|uniref:hypothetical protein n=1 Tax=Enterococcus TaxID=1350 RepID=UPI00070B989A|nr:hypothetical protein [Enterococcus faecalis]KXF69147.1 hypothetical protein AQ486_15335 [Enterococcus faecalis]MBC2813727.1 hypothetical protein [Enterococcus faecalis]MBC2816838.1 hypothetical protein [Enterococcus faecalis]MBC2833576.1 hypothetical protein [Enterococcus faecalis]MBC2849535.1 hypothetical protein [Enterococcus faecalis]
MIEVRGLGNDIYELMLANAHNNIVQSVRTSASYGNTSCVVSSKGATKPFLDQLQIQGVDYIELEDEKIKLFWEGL